jgi:hypothetical protein
MRQADKAPPTHDLVPGVMHAKDGQYAPSLFRQMSNGAGLIELFPARKLSALSMLTASACTSGRSVFDVVLRDGDDQQSSSHRRIARTSKPNSTKLLRAETRRKNRTAILLSPGLSP